MFKFPAFFHKNTYRHFAKYGFSWFYSYILYFQIWHPFLILSRYVCQVCSKMYRKNIIKQQ